MNNAWDYVQFSEAVDICDNLRKPINSTERASRISGKTQSELYPYYGATGQVGFIDDYLMDGEYVLLGEDGAPFLDAFSNKAYIINGKAWVNNHAHVLKSKTSNKFLCYFLNCFNYKGFVSGTTRLKLTQAEMKRILVPVPPLQEQERIVARIEEMLSQLDAGAETLKNTKAQLTVYRQAVLKEAFNSVESSQQVLFGNLMTSVRNGYGLKPDDEGEYRILRIGAVRSMVLDLSDYRCNISPFPSDDTIQENDLLFTRYNGSREYVGVCACVPQLEIPYAYPDKIIKCTPILKDPYHSKYLQYYVSQGQAREYIRSKIKTTSGQNGIAGSDIKKLKVLLPELDEQKRIVEQIESRLSVCDSIEQTVNTALQQAEALRQSILKQAFEGRL